MAFPSEKSSSDSKGSPISASSCQQRTQVQNSSFLNLRGGILPPEMATWKEGDRVRVVKRKVTDEDKKKGRYFDHMAGLTGTIENVYSKDEIAIRVDIDSLSTVTQKVHKEATKRMREKFVNAISEEQKKQLTTEELNFDANYVLLVQGTDLEKTEGKASKPAASKAVVQKSKK